MKQLYDMIVIGGGPAGYTAALYAARAGMSVVVIEKLSAGGQMALTEQIDNYPGFVYGVDGFTLGENMQLQAERFGVKTELADVFSVELDGNVKEITTSDGVYYGKTVVFATGANPRKLGLEHEAEFVGRGVNYCAACDGMFYKDKTVIVIGGGNSVAADALLLSKIAKKVILVHRRDTLRATKIYHEPLLNAENVEFRLNSVVTELLHNGNKINGVNVKHLVTEDVSVAECDGVFISIGRVPATEIVRDKLDLTPDGYIVADESTKTNIPGVFAVGDVRTKALRQIVTAVSDGAVAAFFAEEYLAGIE